MDQVYEYEQKKVESSFLFLSCVSCNGTVVAIHHKGCCSLTGLINYMNPDVSMVSTNLFAFTCCTECDSSSAVRGKRTHAMLHPDFARRSISYDAIYSLTKGNIDIAISGTKVSFIDRHETDSVIYGPYTLKDVQYHYSDRYVSPVAVIIEALSTKYILL